MKTTTWTDLKTLTLPSRPAAGAWTLVLDLVPANTQLRITCSGTWTYTEGFTSGPDGDPMSAMKGLLVASAPAGCVVGRFGGSTAGLAGDMAGFAVGSSCVPAPPAASVPLYLTINVNPTALISTKGTMTVTISEAS
ncbi:MAG TPA: hypothetical protein VGR02_15340 [Thermoanaerobaculia bacterium]|jgi:hypothetical protein|nr:hypothetical protein [Thermoanaerobaculia bacterium]